jgi:hypothetical protein
LSREVIVISMAGLGLVSTRRYRPRVGSISTPTDRIPGGQPFAMALPPAALSKSSSLIAISTLGFLGEGLSLLVFDLSREAMGISLMAGNGRSSRRTGRKGSR